MLERLRELKRRIRFEYVGLPKMSVGHKSQCLLTRLPVELLEYIFALACMDGGYTGCSLSRVSRFVRKAARAGRFTSISLHSRSPQQLSRFVSFLSTECADAKATGFSPPKVRHLYLETAKCDGGPPQEAYEQDALSLLGLVAPDLCTLFLIQVRHYLPRDVGRMSFPQLRELTVYGDGLPFTPFPLSMSLPPFPSLSHFHLMIAGASKIGYPPVCCDLRRWAERAPCNTHLRLSNLSGSIDFSVDIAAEGDEAGPARPCMNHLELLIMQPRAPPPSGGWCGTPRMQYATFCASLHHIQSAATFRVGLGPFVPAKDLSEKKLECAARREWRNRLGGGAGCWEVDESWFTEESFLRTMNKA